MSKTDERSTPLELFKMLDDEFHFNIDLAATEQNALCKNYYTKEYSAFQYDWVHPESHFCNPPYSDIFPWVAKAISSTGLIVMILPCDTSTKWFTLLWDRKLHKTHDNVQLRFPEGRFKFGKYTTSPKFATIIAIING